jgi:hypothetical protein
MEGISGGVLSPGTEEGREAVAPVAPIEVVVAQAGQAGAVSATPVRGGENGPVSGGEGAESSGHDAAVPRRWEHGEVRDSGRRPSRRGYGRRGEGEDESGESGEELDVSAHPGVRAKRSKTAPPERVTVRPCGSFMLAHGNEGARGLCSRCGWGRYPHSVVLNVDGDRRASQRRRRKA